MLISCGLKRASFLNYPNQSADKSLHKKVAACLDRTNDLQIFSLTLEDAGQYD